MKKEIQDQLDQIFEKKKQVDDLRALEVDQQKLRETKAAQDFQALCGSMIRPTMERMGAYLVSKGFAYEIVKGSDEFVVVGGPAGRPEITMLISTSSSKPFRDPTGTPYFKVVLNPQKGSVTFQRSTITRDRGGSTSDAGEAALGALTEDLLDAKIADTISQIFR